MKTFLTLQSLFFLLLLSPFLQGQVMSNASENTRVDLLQGLVIDKVTGEPVVGASILIKGEIKGVISDANGHFSLAVSPNTLLKVSCIGYADQEVTSAPNMTIVLSESSENIDEVVVTAMGIARQSKTLTYAAQTIGGGELTKVKEVNFVNSLQGKSAGLTIVPNATGAGGSTKILLRGVSSFGNNTPLIVVDGIPMVNKDKGQQGFGNVEYEGSRDGGDAMSNINSDDIASITVLKGANAAALYGSAAGNGVLLITTKKGHAGSLRIDISSNTVVETPLVLPKLQKKYTVKEFNDKGQIIDYWGDTYENSTVNYPAGFTNHYNDNLKVFYTPGVTSTNSFSINAGSTNAQSYFSYSNTASKGITPDNKFLRHNFNYKQNYSAFNNHLQLTFQGGYMYQKVDNTPTSGRSSTTYNVYTSPGSLDLPYYKKNFERDPNDSQRDSLYRAENVKVMNWPIVNDFSRNPYFMTNRMKPESKRTRYNLGLQLTYNIIEGLSISARGAYERTDDLFQQNFYASWDNKNWGTKDIGRFIHDLSWDDQLFADAIINFTKKIGDFDLIVLAGGSYQHNRSDVKNTNKYLNIDTTNFKQRDITNQFILNGTWGNSTTQSEYFYLRGRTFLGAVFGSLSIGWRELVYLEVTGRTDWSSTFVDNPTWSITGRPYYFYPSFGVNTLLNKYIPLPKWFNLLKLRASYSQVSTPFPDALQLYIAPSKAIATLQSIEPITKAKPESVKSFEAGLLLGFLNDNLSLELTYYDTQFADQYMLVPTGSTSGYKNRYVNEAAMQNKGVEVTASYNIGFLNNELLWETVLNFSYNYNKVLKLPENNKVINYISNNGLKNITTEGVAFGDLWTFDYARDNAGKILKNGEGGPAGSNKYDYFLGNGNAPFSIGWNNTFSWKNIRLSFLIDGKIGGKVFSYSEAEFDKLGYSQRSADARDQGYIDVEGVRFDPKIFYQTTGQGYFMRNYTYSATNFRLRELSIGYLFQNLFGKGKNLQLSFIARNLFFFYNRAPHDPDVSFSTGVTMQGIEAFTIPTTRSTGLNIKLNF